MSDLLADPFRERVAPRHRRRFTLLGASVQFETGSSQLLRLVDEAFGGLPPHRLANPAPRLTVRLVLATRGAARKSAIRAPFELCGGAGLLFGGMDAGNFAVMCPRDGSALVSISPALLRAPRQARYELIEFATMALVARALELVALHAACVGEAGEGVLMLGDSGAGKSTLSLQALVDGMEYLAEDSVFVKPGGLLATAVPAFLHLHADSLRFLGRHPLRRRIRAAPVIRRRSGARKFELDLRRCAVSIAAAPMRLRAVVVLTGRGGGAGAPLRRISRRKLLRALDRTQPHARGTLQWSEFRRRLARLRAYELHKTDHPRIAVEALRAILDARRPGLPP